MSNMSTKKTILAARQAVVDSTMQLPANNELGIDNAKVVSGFLGQLVSAVANVDANKDGKISLLEILAKAQVIAFAAISQLSGISLKAALAELKDLNSDERQRLIANFASTFELANRDAEWLVEDWLFWLEEGFSLFGRTKAMWKKEDEPAG